MLRFHWIIVASLFICTVKIVLNPKIRDGVCGSEGLSSFLFIVVQAPNFLLVGGNLLRDLPLKTMLVSRNINTRPPFIQKFYDKMESLGDDIDQEANVGANMPFRIENPRWFALKTILFIGVALNLPLYITYRQLKANNNG